MFEFLNEIYLINDNVIHIYTNQPHVHFIYNALFLIMILMTFMSLNNLLSTKNEYKVFKENFVFTDFLINFPITLGIIGTLYSISRSVSESEKNNLSDIISSNFDAAVMTTIVGGLVYGYCFFLQAAVSKYVHRKYQ